MFWCKYHIFCAWSFKNRSPFIWIIIFSFEEINELPVRKVLSIISMVIPQSSSVTIIKTIQVPLCITTLWTPGGHRIEPPMDEYAKFCIFKPLRGRSCIQWIPIRLIVLSIQEHDTKNCCCYYNPTYHFNAEFVVGASYDSINVKVFKIPNKSLV